MTQHAITVLGHDRPGIIAETTRALADLGLNLEDSTMTLLRGHFAMMLICEGTASAEQIRSALASLSEGGSLSVEVRDIAAEQPSEPAGAGYVLTVHGGDRPGIVSAVASEVAAVAGNVTDLTTRLAGDLYLLIAEIDLPADADPDALATSLGGVAADLGVRVTLTPAETDDL